MAVDAFSFADEFPSIRARARGGAPGLLMSGHPPGFASSDRAPHSITVSHVSHAITHVFVNSVTLPPIPVDATFRATGKWVNV
jgi:hypothetical protein